MLKQWLFHVELYGRVLLPFHVKRCISFQPLVFHPAHLLFFFTGFIAKTQQVQDAVENHPVQFVFGGHAEGFGVFPNPIYADE